MSSRSRDPEIPDGAEATDGAELGEEVGDEVRPGTIDYPPTEPVGVGPAGSILDAEHHDSLADRLKREVPEDHRPPHDTVVLVDEHSSGEPDDERELIGEAVPPVELASPEESAMHYESEQDQ